MFFPDLAHNVIYMKRFNTNSGAADVFEFKLDVPREKQEHAPAQVAGLCATGRVYRHEGHSAKPKRRGGQAEKARWKGSEKE